MKNIRTQNELEFERIREVRSIGDCTETDRTTYDLRKEMTARCELRDDDDLGQHIDERELESRSPSVAHTRNGDVGMGMAGLLV